MEFSQETITEAWLLIGLACLPFSIINLGLVRILLCVCFLVFAVVSVFRPITIGSDTHNYLLHAEAYCSGPASVKTWFGGNFEPGYNALIHAITRASCEPRFIFLIIGILTALVWVYSFLKYRIHPSVIMLIFSGVTLVGSIAALRHHLAMALMFFIICRREFKGPAISFPYYFLPPLIHYSTIPAVLILALADTCQVKRTKVVPLFVSTVLVVVLSLNTEFIEKLLTHAADRISGNSGSTGLRNLMAFLIVALAVIDFRHHRIKFSGLKFEIIASLLACLILLLFPGLNRMSGFFWLIALVFFANVIGGRREINTAVLVVFVLNLSSLFFFFGRFS